MAVRIGIVGPVLNRLLILRNRLLKLTEPKQLKDPDPVLYVFKTMS